MGDEHRWKAGEKRWIAAMTDLIHGFDGANVSATVFLGMPYGLLNLYQGSGRGGRDGHCGSSIVLAQSGISQMESMNTTMDKDLICQAEGIW